MLFVCISHRRSLFSSVTAIPPTPPLILALRYEQTDTPVRAGTLRKQRETQGRVNFGPAEDSVAVSQAGSNPVSPTLFSSHCVR